MTQTAAFPRWHLAAVAAIAVLVYANTLSSEFVWDDETQIVKNPAIRTLSNLPQAFTKPFWSFAAADGASQTNFYRPVQTVLYTLAYAAGGLDPTPYHAINITLHALASVFLYLVCLRLTFTPIMSLAAAALFAVHPIHTEAVAWIAGVPDVACGMFYIAAVWAFLNRSWTASLLYLAALLSKEMAITLPFFLLLLTYRPGAPAMTLTQRVKALAPFAIVTAIYLAMRASALGFLATSHLDVNASVLDWITLGVQAFARYVWFAIVPYPLHAYHLLPIHLDDRVPATLASLAAVAALAALAWRFRARFWLAAFAILLLPVFYFKGISTAFVAERYLYIPSIAVILFAAPLLTRIKWAGWALAGAFAIVTFIHNSTWMSSEQLYATSLAVQPEAAHFHLNLAEIRLKRASDSSAREHLQSALAVVDSNKYAQTIFERYRARIGLGAVEARTQNFEKARSLFEEARQIYPAGEWAYIYLGGLSMQADGNDQQAIAYFREAVRLGPGNEVAHDSLGIALANTGQLQEAAASFQRALEINPTYQDARAHLNAVMPR